MLLLNRNYKVHLRFMQKELARLSEILSKEKDEKKELRRKIWNLSGKNIVNGVMASKEVESIRKTCKGFQIVHGLSICILP